MAKKSVDKKSNSTSSIRPPIVSILGHVDHGKTTLLDYIRKSSISREEVGGITQRIGAYQISNPSKITFIDTPGHEAFSAMRSRGAQAADLAVLIVAADDSVMPQTIESIKYVKEAGIPVLVAINKIDVPEANVDKVKKDLLKHDMAVEGYGGKIVAAEISAKTGEGIDEFLEMIGIVSQLTLNLKIDKKASFSGVVIESNLDKKRGSQATVIVKSGVLKLRDTISTGAVSGKVKAIYDDLGYNVSSAGPSKPVVILGLNGIAEVGSLVKKISASDQVRSAGSATKTENANLKSKDKEIIRFIVRADTSGALESVVANLPDGVKIISAEVSEAVTRSDIEYAISTKSAIIGYNVIVSNLIKQYAQTSKVVLRTYKLIYELLEETDDVVLELTKEPEEVIIGRAKVLATFKIDNKNVAGVRVEEGKFKIGDKVKVETETFTSRGKVVSIKENKVEIKEALGGKEYGIGISDELDFDKDDVIMAYNII